MITQVKDPIIEAHNLTVVYRNKPALWNVDFSLPKGQIIGIMGPNGSGKSTLLKSIMDIVDVSSGHVNLFGQNIDMVRKKISYVPQRQEIDWDFPANVTDVVKMGRYAVKGLFKRLSSEDKSIVNTSIEKVKLTPYRKRQIAQLSGGQQQRVFLARSIAQQAELYLMDEPFSGVDAATENAIITLLKEMKEEGKTVVVVHHDLHTAEQYFDWLVLLNTKLVASGPTKDVFTDKILKETYGGSLSTLAKITQVMTDKEFPIRHK